MNENRKFIRLRVPLGIQYTVIKKHKKPRLLPSALQNISIAGLSLLVKEIVRPGDILNLVIEVPHHEQPIHLTGDVVWCDQALTIESDEKSAGVRFRDANPKELNRLLDYVYSVAISQ